MCRCGRAGRERAAQPVRATPPDGRWTPACCRPGPALHGRRAGARAGAVCAGRADGQLVQAPDGGRIAVGHHLGPGLRGPWPQQPHCPGAHAAGPLRMAAARCQRQPLPGHRRRDRCRAGRHRPPAGPRPGLHDDLFELPLAEIRARGIAAAAADAGRGLRRAGGRQRAVHRAGLHADSSSSWHSSATRRWPTPAMSAPGSWSATPRCSDPRGD
jgi:hypothetical protein